MLTPGYVFKCTPNFRKAFENLSPEDQQAAKEAFKIFKANPFDASLKTHKIIRLSALAKRTVYSVTIGGNLRAVFSLDGNTVISTGIGTHDIYK